MLALAACQKESREMANRKKKGKKCIFFAQARSLKAGLKKFGKKGKKGARKEIKKSQMIELRGSLGTQVN